MGVEVAIGSAAAISKVAISNEVCTLMSLCDTLKEKINYEDKIQRCIVS